MSIPLAFNLPPAAALLIRPRDSKTFRRGSRKGISMAWARGSKRCKLLDRDGPAGRESPRIGLHSICLRNFGYEIMPATSSHFLGKCLDGRCMSVMLTGHFIRGNGNADAVVHILSQLKAWNFTWGRRAAANIVQMHALYMSLAYRLKSNMIHAEAWPGF